MAKVTKSRKVQYLGVNALRWEVRSAGASGLRVLVIQWQDKAIGQETEHEAGTVVLDVITGSGARGTLETLDRQVRTDLIGADTDSINRAAETLLAQVARIG